MLPQAVWAQFTPLISCPHHLPPGERGSGSGTRWPADERCARRWLASSSGQREGEGDGEEEERRGNCEGRGEAEEREKGKGVQEEGERRKGSEEREVGRGHAPPGPGRPQPSPAGAKAGSARKICPVPRLQHQSWFPASPKVVSFEVWQRWSHISG